MSTWSRQTVWKGLPPAPNKSLPLIRACQRGMWMNQSYVYKVHRGDSRILQPMWLPKPGVVDCDYKLGSKFKAPELAKSDFIWSQIISSHPYVRYGWRPVRLSGQLFLWALWRGKKVAVAAVVPSSEGKLVDFQILPGSFSMWNRLQLLGNSCTPWLDIARRSQAFLTTVMMNKFLTYSYMFPYIWLTYLRSFSHLPRISQIFD